jgi:HK97 family phage major capsid protein
MGGHIKSATQLIAEVQEIYKRADLSERDLDAGERKQVEDALVEVKSKKSIEDLGRELGVGMDSLSQGQAFAAGDAGARFVQSDGYKAIKDASSRGQQWTSGLVDVGYSMKGTLLEGTGAPGTGTGGGWIPSPQVVPGMVGKLFQPLTLEALLLSGQATTNTVRYAVEGTATSAAAGVAEAGQKPESTLAFSTLDEPIKKIATVLTISDELVEDAPAVQQFINGQLSLFVQIEAERQLFRGTSGGNEVQGILTSRGVPVYAGTVTDTKADQLFKAMNGLRGSAFVEPEWIVIHPTDWQAIRLLKDGTGGTAGNYYGGGPFMGPYGAGVVTDASGQVTGAQDTLWNKQVYVTSAIGGAGTALIGSRAAAQVWSRGGMKVEASNSHSTNFVFNLTAIRAERRLGLTVYRPTALTEVRLV